MDILDFFKDVLKSVVIDPNSEAGAAFRSQLQSQVYNLSSDNDLKDFVTTRAKTYLTEEADGKFFAEAIKDKLVEQTASTLRSDIEIQSLFRAAMIEYLATPQGKEYVAQKAIEKIMRDIYRSDLEKWSVSEDGIMRILKEHFNK